MVNPVCIRGNDTNENVLPDSWTHLLPHIILLSLHFYYCSIKVIGIPIELARILSTNWWDINDWSSCMCMTYSLVLVKNSLRHTEHYHSVTEIILAVKALLQTTELKWREGWLHFIHEIKWSYKSVSFKGFLFIRGWGTPLWLYSTHWLKLGVHDEEVPWRSRTKFSHQNAWRVVSNCVHWSEFSGR